MEKQHIEYLTPDLLKSEEEIWVNPVGGLGDIIVLSTAMKRSFDKYGHKFNLMRRSQYTQFFVNHPAVKTIGNPEPGSNIVCNDYWMRKDFCNLDNKALQITCKIFGVDWEGDDTTYVAEPPESESLRIKLDMVPWREKNVIICFSSESPRKMMHPVKWHIIVEKLLAQQCFVAQVGMLQDIHIKGAYSLLGTTTPMELFSILRKADCVITPDNFIMHAAHAVGVPAVSLFGPTEVSRYGYSDQIPLQADTSGCELRNECLGPHVSKNYSTQCPLAERHCMNSLDEHKIVDIAMRLINK